MTQLAYVTFKEGQGADNAMLMLGATVVDCPISITPAKNYQMPPYAPLTLMRAVRVSNVSISARVKDIRDFFSYYRNIQLVELQRESEMTQGIAYVTFKEAQGVDTAMLMSILVVKHVN